MKPPSIRLKFLGGQHFGIDLNYWFVIVCVIYTLNFPMLTIGAGRVEQSLTTPGYSCYLRCLAKCIRVSGSALDQACDTQCKSYRDDRLCNTTDAVCWSTCKDLIDRTLLDNEPPSTPRNLTTTYVRYPQPDPYQADLRWSFTFDRSIYLIQYVEDTEDEARNSIWTHSVGSNITTENRFRFIKTDLCSRYAFRIAAINPYGISPFSEVVTLAEPKPIVPAPFYDLISAELIDRPFDSMQIFNQDDRSLAATTTSANRTIRILIEFAPPPNWNLSSDIVRVTGEFYPESAGEQRIGYAPIKRWIPGTSQFELLLPAIEIGGKTNLNFKLIFSVQKIITKCDEEETGDRSIGYQYSTMVYNQRRRMMLPVFEFDLNCRNIRNSQCPYDERASLPSCGVRSIKIQPIQNNSTSLIYARVDFDRLSYGRPQQAIDHLLVTYGYGDQDDEDVSDALPDFIPPRMSRLIESIVIENITTTNFVLPNLNSGHLYVVYICAIYVNGSTQIDYNLTSRYVIDLTDTSDGASTMITSSASSIPLSILVALPISIALVIALLACVIILRHRIRNLISGKVGGGGVGVTMDRQVSIELNEQPRYVDQPRRSANTDQWELPIERLVIDRSVKLGSGAFGAVFKGRIIGELTHLTRMPVEDRSLIEQCVAVKVLPEYADEKSKFEFRAEINLMKELGYHERLVNMLACVSVTDLPSLAVEYCANGDLLRYLRMRKTYMLDLERTGVDLNDPQSMEFIDRTMVLSFNDVLTFARQISQGLEYISGKGYIHRDVAARNILVDHNRECKIGDFGLCRYASIDPVYTGHGGRLPIKWMALEALKCYQFTTKSDVWSFGVLIYELFTLGNSPYPGMDPCDVERYLETGNRMSQPDQCPLDLYSIMLACWMEDPKTRPNFSQIRHGLGRMLDDSLSSSKDYYYSQHQARTVSARRRESSSAQMDAVVMEECELDDQVFQDDDQTSAPAPAPPPLPPRRHSRTSLSDQHQAESKVAKYGVKFTPSVDLTTVHELVDGPGSSIDRSRASINPSGGSPKLRRRSSTTTTTTTH